MNAYSEKSLNCLRMRFARAGFAIVTAIFLLVILAGLGIFILNVSSTQHATSMLDIEGSRAYWIAKSGIDWGIYQSRRTGTTYACVTGCTINTPACTTPVSAAPAADNIVLGGFTVTVSCTCTPICEAGTSQRFIRLVSTACNQSSGGACPNAAPTGTSYVERQLTATIVAP